MSNPSEAVKDLLPIRIEDIQRFRNAIDDDRRGWTYYFPFLFLNGSTGRNWIYLFEQVNASIVVYRLRERRSGPELSLVAPPFPFEAAAMRRAEARLADFNGRRGCRILYVPESDALAMAREGLAITYLESEYIFDRAAVLAAEGAEFGSLRKELARARNAGQVETRPYAPPDQPACQAILEQWKERLQSQGMRADGYRSTARCLKIAASFPTSLLCGQVVEVDGEIRGFAFSGPISRTTGANFICMTDTEFRGLPQILRCSLMAEFPDLTFFNDATDSGRPGLHALKMRFRPVTMHHVYQARSE